MINYTGTYTDQYQLTMAEVYFLNGQKDTPAVFDYFFRKLPFDGGYVIFAGLEDLIKILETLRFDEKDIKFLKEQGFHDKFLDYLKTFKFSGNIYSTQEGDIVFPTRPVLTVESTLLEAQILETLILNVLNFQTLIATKARRMRQVAGDSMLIDFGLRRAHSVGGYHASRAAMIGGFDATSNVRAGRDYNIPVSGTMAHSFVQSYDKEIDAFRAFASVWPDNCVLLVDTYDTLESGVVNAIIIAKEMEARGERLQGIRLDSGDLANLAKKSRKMLDEAGLTYVSIAASNQLDEYAIKELIDKHAPIDVYGVGTSLVIGRPDAALDGVYKLAMAKEQPRIKLSETIEKITLPCKKQVYRLLDDEGQFIGADLVALEGESTFDKAYYPFKENKTWLIGQGQKEPLLTLVIKKGQRVEEPKSIKEIATYSQQRLDLLPNDYKKLVNPKVYTIGLSEGLNRIRNQLIAEHKHG
ncbi:nicotinate phosphoribosyltransferase [Legionella impletisoli]|uniref:Nicotinate phosphoribosyltransferase n=1 Tax=Legionella impletisoli TaxID=343510 RepID=A0A917JPR0_9GAMM|nr:nicotinate phosphoribosyltransferase [Legionella impletisoli]GGI77432.1 nicotinate phosphoribosyltransferase [Legionella impletisoli]